MLCTMAKTYDGLYLRNKGSLPTLLKTSENQKFSGGSKENIGKKGVNIFEPLNNVAKYSSTIDIESVLNTRLGA